MSAKRVFILAAVFAAWAAHGSAETTGASFLKIGAGARALGMGSAFTAAADDATALFWNPAGLAGLSSRQVTAMHTDWITDVRFDHLAYAHPLAGRGTTIGLGVAHLSQGRLDSRDENRASRGTFHARDAAVTLGLSRAVRPGTQLGANVKYIDQQIEREKAAGWAVDLGGLQQVSKTISLGLSVQNLGPSMRFVEEGYRLPLSVTGGASWRLTHAFVTDVDVRHLVYEKKTSVSVGTEFWVMNRIALRSGYLSSLGGSSGRFVSSSESAASRLSSSLTGMHMGLGLKIYSGQMDYALTPSGEFGSAHRLSLSYRF
jgi:hypothetical protein